MKKSKAQVWKDHSEITQFLDQDELTIAAPLFAFSSVISFVYCCEMGWLYLFGAGE